MHFHFKKMHLKMSPAKWRQFCLGLNELSNPGRYGLNSSASTHSQNHRTEKVCTKHTISGISGTINTKMRWWTTSEEVRNNAIYFSKMPWWRHHLETFSALLAICAGNSPVTGEFPAQRPVTRSFDVFFFICAWINGWLKNGEAGDSRRHFTHYDVTAMLIKDIQ